MIVADAEKGRLSVDKDGNITVLCNEINGVAINFPNDLDIAKDWTIHFSNASTKFSGGDGIFLDLWEHRPHGQLIAYYPDTKKAEIVLQDPTGEKYAPVTCAAEYDGKLYLGSVFKDAIGIVDIE